MSVELVSTIQSLILDFQESNLNTGTARRLLVTPVAGKASVLIGVRRCGKSTFLFQIMQRLLDSGVSRENILYVNFFDDRLRSLRAGNLGLVLEAYYALYPQKKNAEKVYCFFDEIQTLDDWEPFVDRLMRTENCEVYLTGSSARMLSKEIATQMRGRAISWEVFPFSFAEFLDYSGVAWSGALSTKARLTVQKTFEEYWACGGFPEVSALDRHLRVRIHQEYFHAILFRDLVERHDVRHPRAIVDLAGRLIDNAASFYTVNSLAGYLHSLGHTVPKSTVAEYLAWFEDAYFLFSVKLFDASLSRANANPKKAYCIDHALIESVGSGILVNSGHLLENLIFVALRRVTSRVSYYKTSSGREVDFLAQTDERRRLLIQSCESLSDPQTRKREVLALNEAMQELGLTEATIVTRSHDEDIAVAAGTIRAVAAWRFLLNMETQTTP